MSGQPMRYQAAEGVVWQRVDDGLMLLQVKQGLYFELNHSGARMFELLTQGLDVDQVQTNLLQEFAVDTAALQNDLDCLLRDLHQQGLLKPAPLSESAQ